MRKHLDVELARPDEVDRAWERVKGKDVHDPLVVDLASGTRGRT